MARQWRAGSKARATKRGRDLILPSIDEAEVYLKSLPLVCEYCCLVFTNAKKRRPQMDHRVPLGRDGGAELTNLALSCKACNGAKGPLLESEFRELLALVSTWDDGGKTLLARLRGGFYAWTGNGRPGVPKSEETKEKMRAAQQKWSAENPGIKEAFHRERMLGTHPTEETRQKLREAKLGEKNPWFGTSLSWVRAGKVDQAPK